MHRWFTIGIGIGVVLVVAVMPARGHVRPVSLLLPDGDTRPVIDKATLLTPRPTDRLLEVGLDIDASDNDWVASYQYRWSGNDPEPVTTLGATPPKVSYAGVAPNTYHELDVRVIDAHNNPSDWYPVWKGVTPSPPRIIVAGDSIASGYHKTWMTGRATCRDTGLSYGRTLTNAVASRLPTWWAPSYHNVAWAGASVRAVANGGTDSCGEKHRSQIDQIDELVDDDTWNVVVVTAGINSTNWSDVIVRLTRDTALSFTEAGDTRACRRALDEMWNLEEKRDQIGVDTDRVTTQLTRRTSARLVWTGYFDIVDSRIAPLWIPIGSECSRELAEAFDAVHTAVRAGLNRRVAWIPLDEPVALQPWAGWPHPSVEGHETIGQLLGGVIAG